MKFIAERRKAAACAFALFLLFQANRVGGGGREPDPAWKEYNEKAVARWQEIFGNKLDFAEADRFFCLHHLDPQPTKLLQDIDRRVLSPALREGTNYWLGKFFTTQAVPDGVNSTQPKKFYLPQGKFDNGLLYHAWTVKNYRFRMYESGNGVLVRVTPTAYRPDAPIPRAQLAKILRDVLNLGLESDAAVTKAFQIPQQVRVGDFLTNRGAEPFGLVYYWHDYVTVFLSETDLCLLCFKSVGGRMNVDFPRERFWLNHGLMQEDGKTPVAPAPPEDATRKFDSWLCP